jgi:histidyl-tRNA synthetase
MIEKAGVAADAAGRVLTLAETRGSNEEILGQLQERYGRNPKAAEGVARLRELLQVARTAGVAEQCVQIDVAIARGLDYYTGTVYETFLTDLPGIGSVCSGGRYDNLASLYTKQVLPGVGASLGLDRLLAAMEELKLLEKAATAAPVFVVQFTPEKLGEYQRMARQLRAQGIGVEVFPEARRIGQQLTYADKRGFQIALIAGPDEFAKEVWQIKNLKSGESLEVHTSAVLAEIRRLLSGGSAAGS